MENKIIAMAARYFIGAWISDYGGHTDWSMVDHEGGRQEDNMAKNNVTSPGKL